MIKYVLLLLFISIFHIIFIKPTFAHVLKTDGEIGAVIHIDPEDDPIVGRETTIYFDIKDRSGRFKIEECECQFSINKDGTLVYQTLLNGITAQYVFPERNIYTVLLMGKSKNGTGFQPFTLSYAVRVERESPVGNIQTGNKPEVTSSNFWHFWHYGFIAIIMIGLLFFWMLNKKKT